ncbi:hypothetical protein ACV348_32655, partial [Pseudomonas aeruginosa]
LSDAERAAAHARRASLHALLEQERWLDVQLQVKIESEFLKRDLAEREERAIRQAAESRQQHRHLQENASACRVCRIAALAASGLASRAWSRALAFSWRWRCCWRDSAAWRMARSSRSARSRLRNSLSIFTCSCTSSQ